MVSTITVVKKGKKGHEKAHIVARDIFTGKKIDFWDPHALALDVPEVTHYQYQLLDVDVVSGQARVVTESGIKDDLYLPLAFNDADAKDKKLTDEILRNQELGIGQVVTVLTACGNQKIVDTKAGLLDDDVVEAGEVLEDAEDRRGGVREGQAPDCGVLVRPLLACSLVLLGFGPWWAVGPSCRPRAAARPAPGLLVCGPPVPLRGSGLQSGVVLSLTALHACGRAKRSGFGGSATRRARLRP